MKVMGDVRYSRKVGNAPGTRMVRGVEIFDIKVEDKGMIHDYAGMFLWCSRKFEANLQLAKTDTLKDNFIWSCPDQPLPASVRIKAELTVDTAKVTAHLEQTYACIPSTREVLALIFDVEREIERLAKAMFTWID